uniref:Transposase n=1 Tax=Heterorhabditis bacteriophora TaxID=37862 RepID=A0A1I7WG74_HETBA
MYDIIKILLPVKTIHEFTRNTSQNMEYCTGILGTNRLLVIEVIVRLLFYQLTFKQKQYFSLYSHFNQSQLIECDAIRIILDNLYIYYIKANGQPETVTKRGWSQKRTWRKQRKSYN